MSTDLSMLAWTTGLTALFWLPYILARIAKYGLTEALTYRADSLPVPAWADRAKKAHYNAVENLVIFAALVLVAHLTGAANAATAAAAITYFVARLVHYPVYVAGIPLMRTLMFAVGWLAQVCIFYQIVT
ncbi:MAG: MAPEG family protein [Alphaproteobacteria bacterium]|nr:MAPEG family protein [Alphaproteobacteria bacterium]